MPFDNLLIERDGALVYATINRPRVLNALNAQTLDELRRTVLQLKHDAAVRAVIITAINRGLEMPFAEACLYEATLFGLVASTEDMREGTSAFLAKRKAEFKGK